MKVTMWFVMAIMLVVSPLTVSAQYVVLPEGHGVGSLKTISFIENPEGVVTDSTVWRTVAIDSLNLGKPDCNHDWKYSKARRFGGNLGCLVNHNGSHCDWDDMVRERICKLCLRWESQREVWYQHRKQPEKTEFDSLLGKLKQR